MDQHGRDMPYRIDFDLESRQNSIILLSVKNITEEYHRLRGKRTGTNASRLCTGLQFLGLPHAEDPVSNRHQSK